MESRPNSSRKRPFASHGRRRQSPSYTRLSYPTGGAEGLFSEESQGKNTPGRARANAIWSTSPFSCCPRASVPSFSSLSPPRWSKRRMAKRPNPSGGHFAAPRRSLGRPLQTENLSSTQTGFGVTVIPTGSRLRGARHLMRHPLSLKTPASHPRNTSKPSPPWTPRWTRRG